MFVADFELTDGRLMKCWLIKMLRSSIEFNLKFSNLKFRLRKFVVSFSQLLLTKNLFRHFWMQGFSTMNFVAQKDIQMFIDEVYVMIFVVHEFRFDHAKGIHFLNKFISYVVHMRRS